MGKYFDRFPLVNYNGITTRNILTKVDFFSDNNINSKFDFVLSNDTSRTDLLSYATYDSTKYDWLIWLTNKVIDPYEDVYKSEIDFENFIMMKYGSAAEAVDTILFYRNNWAADDKDITIDEYDSYTQKIQKYYTPKLNINDVIHAYSRRQEDWVCSTNKIIQIIVDDASVNYITQKFTQGFASGIVDSVDYSTNTLILKHIVGVFVTDDIIQSIDIIKNNISDDEIIFWEAVNAYDYEHELNEIRRYITLYKNSYLQDIDTKFSNEMNK